MIRVVPTVLMLNLVLLSFVVNPPRLSNAQKPDTWTVEQLVREPDSGEGELRWQPRRVDLAPAQWIWLPSQRTLPNTFELP